MFLYLAFYAKMSDVWEFFQKNRNDENIITSFNCQLCEAEYGVSTSTTTLRRHLISAHSSIYVSNNEPKQNSSYTSAEQSHIITKLAQWIAVDFQPFSIVE